MFLTSLFTKRNPQGKPYIKVAQLMASQQLQVARGNATSKTSKYNWCAYVKK